MARIKIVAHTMHEDELNFEVVGAGLQNSLLLMLEHSKTRQKWFGNANRQTQLPGPDLGNNVQVIRIEAPASGAYRIQVDTPTLLHPPQAFSLVVTGDLTSDLVAV